MNKFLKSTLSILLVCSLLVIPTTGVSAAQYNDFNTIVNTGINTTVPQKLNIANPSGNIKTASGTYYITGTSDPNAKLYMNGQEVTGRGMYGSFGVYAALASGANTYEFVQGKVSKSITITKVASSQLPYTPATRVSSMRPTNDDVGRAGEEYVIKCIAPAGAQVTANVNGAKIPLKQVAAASPGIAAVFQGSCILPSVSAISDLGNIKYTMTYNGNSSAYNSAGTLYVAPKDAKVAVQVVQNAALTFTESNYGNGYEGTLKYGSMAYVTDTSSEMFKLTTGGWLPKECVKILPDVKSISNKVSDVRFESTADGEQIIFTGTAKPSFNAYNSADKLSITFYNTTGIDAVPIKGSKIFSGAAITENGNSVTIDFTKKSSGALWGYNIEYNSNETIIYCKKPPRISSDPSLPLKGVTVALDAGHGGNDSGAPGVTWHTGPNEKTLNLDAAIAAGNRLESLGAKVLLLRNDDSTMSMDERMNIAEKGHADFFISLHCNSIAPTSNGAGAGGVEVYYYESAAKPFASTISRTLASYTGRSDRGPKHNYFRVTLNTYAPSVLVEQGFLTNPVEYDKMCSPEALYQTANAIGDSVLAMLS